MKRELTLERENYLNELVKLSGKDADGLHTDFIRLSQIFDGIERMLTNRIEDIMERMKWAYRSEMDNSSQEGKKELLNDYGDIYRLMLILSRNEDMIMEMNDYCDAMRDDLEKIMI